MIKKKYCAILIIIIIAIALLISKNFVGKEHLIIIHQTWVGDGLIHLAKEKGFLEKNGVEVEILRVEGASERRALLASKKADISFETIDMSLGDIATGTPEIIVFMLDDSLGADGIIATQDIQLIRDLKDKKIGCSVGDPPYFLLRILMKREGLEKNEIRILDIQAEEAGAAFVSGDIDAACTWEPWLSKANERKGGHLLVSSADLPGTIVDVMVVRPEILDNRGEEVKAIMKSWLEAYEYSRENPKESYEIMGKAFDLSGEEFEKFIQGIKWNDLEENKEFFNSKIFEVASEINNVAFEDGMISNKVDIHKIIDSTLVREL